MDRLGDFKLTREIGRGGMGVVYEARQVSLDRRVALKVLPPGLGLTDQAVRRFDREARAAAKLHHSNIVPVHATGQDAGCHYYAMDLIEGPTLSAVLRDMNREPDQAWPGESSVSVSGSENSTSSRGRFDAVAKLIADVADALHYAHSRGIVHRDIKPANLMLSADGRLCVTDFGLARIVQEPGMTVSGSFLGTPAYMSPEQVAAGRIAIDHRTDVYSLGAVLYEMLTLRRPFPGDSRDKILTGILTKEPPAPRKVDPRVPLDLETICQKAMEKDVDRRYQSAGEMADDLRRYLAHGLIEARRAGPLRRAVKLVQRRPVLAVSLLAAVLLGAVGGLALRASSARAREELRALAGDARFAFSQGAYRDALAKADRALALDAGFSEARVLRARSLMHLWRAPEAMREAERLLEENPDDWIAHAIVVSAAGWPGNRLDVDREAHLREVERLAPETAEAYTLRAGLADDATEALSLLDRAIALEPGNVEALIARGFRYLEMLDFPAALADAERTIAARPRSVEGHLLKANVVANNNSDWEGARAEIEAALESDPDNPLVHFYLALAHEQVDRDPLRALERLDRAVALDPQNRFFIEQRGHRLVGLGRYEEGLEVADALESLDPERLAPLALRLRAYLGLGDRERLDETLTGMETLAPTFSDPQRRGDAFAQVREFSLAFGENERALAAADAVVEAREEQGARVSWWAYLSRARVYRVMGDEEAFQADCDRAAEVDLQQGGPLSTRAWLLHQDCDRDEAALRDAGRVVELAPRWAHGYHVRALLRQALEDYDGAVGDLGKTLELAPQDTQVYHNRSLILNRLGRFEKALRDADTMVRLMPAAADGYTDRAEVLRNLGDLEGALAAHERAVELQPHETSARVWAAAVRAETPGQCERVGREIDEALALDPENTRLKMQIGLVHLETLREVCPELYDSTWALAAARREFELNPSNENAQLAYGIALYRGGSFEEALGPLGIASRMLAGGPQVTLVESMALWRLGREDEARRRYDGAVAWIERSGCKDPVLLRLRREAEALIGS